MQGRVNSICASFLSIISGLNANLAPMKYQTDDLRIKEIKELLPPARLLGDFPLTEKAAETVYETARRFTHSSRADDRLLAIMGRARFTTRSRQRICPRSRTPSSVAPPIC